MTGEGRPFFVVNTAANPGLIAVLRQEIIPRLLKEVPHQPQEEELKADPVSVPVCDDF